MGNGEKMISRGYSKPSNTALTVGINGNNVYSSQLPSNVKLTPVEVLSFVCLYIYEFPRHVQHAALATLNIQYLSTHIACLLSHYYTPLFLLFVVQRIEYFIKNDKREKK